MGSYLRIWKIAAWQIGDVAFFKLFFPLALVAVPALLAYYGWRGIVRRKTRFFFSPGIGRVRGAAAVATGLLYWVMALVLLAVLGPVTWYLIFQPSGA